MFVQNKIGILQLTAIILSDFNIYIFEMIWPASITLAFLLFIPVSPNNEALAGNNTLAI